MRNTETMQTKNDVIISIVGTVVHGKGFGRFLSIPTANIDTNCDISSMQEGVYSSKIKVDDIVRLGTVNIGRRPTVDNLEKFTIEVNILDFNSDIYGKFVQLDVYELLRPTQRFDSLASLIRQIRTDSLATLDYFGMSLSKKGVVFDLQNNRVIFNGTVVPFDDMGIGLMFIMLLNPSCTFSFEQIYHSVWHENVRKESHERVISLIEKVNNELSSKSVGYKIEALEKAYKISKT